MVGSFPKKRILQIHFLQPYRNRFKTKATCKKLIIRHWLWDIFSTVFNSFLKENSLINSSFTVQWLKMAVLLLKTDVDEEGTANKVTSIYWRIYKYWTLQIQYNHQSSYLWRSVSVAPFKGNLPPSKTTTGMILWKRSRLIRCMQ